MLYSRWPYGWFTPSSRPTSRAERPAVEHQRRRVAAKLDAPVMAITPAILLVVLVLIARARWPRTRS